MATRDLVSIRTRLLLKEELASQTLRQIRYDFDGEGFEPDLAHVSQESGERRSLVDQYYAKVEWANHAAAQGFMNILARAIERRANSSAWGYSEDAKRESERRVEMLKAQMRKDGWECADGEARPLTASPAIAHARTIAARFDLPELRRQVDRIQHSVDADPRLAIGTSKELVETVAKTILEERGVPHDPNWNLVRLVTEARRLLQLLPEDIGDDAEGADRFRALLGNLGTVVQNLGEIRTKFGTGHGPAPSQKGLQPRHARLVAGSACTLAVFLYETHLERPK